ncbi:MAG: hypothetical protein HY585_04785 [Candidatus Omnitrophica bacterium]|nr:hypothetical protein [Candidatus Omnitrophota bacterium]
METLQARLSDWFEQYETIQILKIVMQDGTFELFNLVDDLPLQSKGGFLAFTKEQLKRKLDHLEISVDDVRFGLRLLRIEPAHEKAGSRYQLNIAVKSRAEVRETQWEAANIKVLEAQISPVQSQLGSFEVLWLGQADSMARGLGLNISGDVQAVLILWRSQQGTHEPIAFQIFGGPSEFQRGYSFYADAGVYNEKIMKDVFDQYDSQNRNRALIRIRMDVLSSMANNQLYAPRVGIEQVASTGWISHVGMKGLVDGAFAENSTVDLRVEREKGEREDQQDVSPESLNIGTRIKNIEFYDSSLKPFDSQNGQRRYRVWQLTGADEIAGTLNLDVTGNVEAVIVFWEYSNEESVPLFLQISGGKISERQSYIFNIPSGEWLRLNDKLFFNEGAKQDFVDQASRAKENKFVSLATLLRTDFNHSKMKSESLEVGEMHAASVKTMGHLLDLGLDSHGAIAHQPIKDIQEGYEILMEILPSRAEVRQVGGISGVSAERVERLPIVQRVPKPEEKPRTPSEGDASERERRPDTVRISDEAIKKEKETRQDREEIIPLKRSELREKEIVEDITQELLGIPSDRMRLTGNLAVAHANRAEMRDLLTQAEEQVSKRFDEARKQMPEAVKALSKLEGGVEAPSVVEAMNRAGLPLAFIQMPGPTVEQIAQILNGTNSVAYGQEVSLVSTEDAQTMSEIASALSTFNGTALIHYSLSAQDISDMDNRDSTIGDILEVGRNLVRTNPNFVFRAEIRGVSKYAGRLTQRDDDMERRIITGNMILFVGKSVQDYLRFLDLEPTIMITSTRVPGRTVFTDKYADGKPFTYDGEENVEVGGQVIIATAAQLTERVTDALVPEGDDGYRPKSRTALEKLTLLIQMIAQSARAKEARARAA